ncbi:MAG TPA: GAF domain-containing protein [Trebonia sp.]|jgi:signal transduction histidine kinase/DNA-binding NarL/FixJ family response regulator|nr:GAF domain-containing protein [Trebonia sp.]
MSADTHATGPQRRQGAAARAASLIAVAEDLAGEFSLRPLLERILLRCTELLDCNAGSICSVDEAAGTYRKEADIGVACQSGRVFPLTEGMTGAVVAHRAPVWFTRYDQVPGGHVAAADRATLRGVIGVPLEWRGRVIGACIVFSRDERRVFGPDDAELLELFARHAAIALATARMHEVAEERARAEATAAERDRLLGEVHDSLARRLASIRIHLDSAEGQLARVADGTRGELAQVARRLRTAGAEATDAIAEARLTLLGLAQSPLNGQTLDTALRSEAAWAESIGGLEVRFVTAGTPAAMDDDLSHEVFRVAREALTSIVRHAGARSVRLGLLYEQAFVTLLVQDDGAGFDPTAADEQGELRGLRASSERARSLGATVQVDSLAGWGTRIRARFPYRPPDEPDAGRLRVLIAAGRPVLRAGLARLLSGTEPGIAVVGEAATAREALEACDVLKPDVVLADLGMSAGDVTADSGESAAGLLLGHDPGLAVVGLCDVGDERLVASAMRAGARGCVDMGADGPELARAVIAAGRGQAILSGAVLRQLRRGLRDDGPGTVLTDREQQVRSLMEQGLPDKLIAERLVLSIKTVEKHAGAVLRKTGARNRTELAAQASGTRPRKSVR